MDDKTLKKLQDMLDKYKGVDFKSQFEDVPSPKVRHLIWTSSHDRFVYYCGKHNLSPKEAFRLTWERILGLEGEEWKVVIPDDFVQIEMQLGTSRFLDLAYLLITRGFTFEEGTKESLTGYREARIKQLQKEAQEEERRNQKFYRKKD